MLRGMADDTDTVAKPEGGTSKAWLWILLGCGGLMLLGAFVLFVVLPTLFLPRFVERIDQLLVAHEVEREARANPEVRALLGEPLEGISDFEEGLGTFELSRNGSSVEASVLVQGSKDTAIVKFEGSKEGESWVPTRVVLVHEELTVDLLHDEHEPAD